MTLADGKPHDAFQAQDVWIGVQYSVATAMRLAGKSQQSITLMDTLYQALYHLAKIPFAAPEASTAQWLWTNRRLEMSLPLVRLRRASGL